MVKQLKNKMIQKENQSQAENQGGQVNHENGMNQSQQMKTKKVQKSTEGENSEWEGSHSERVYPQGHSLLFRRPRAGRCPVQPKQTGSSQNHNLMAKCPKVTKTIKKNDVKIPRNPGTKQNSNAPETRPPRKINHRKYTVKKCSNYLRKTLKKNGFNDFKRLEGGGEGAQVDRNKRGSTIYLPVGLLILRYILKGELKFKAFVKNYLQELESLQQKEQRKYRANRNEKSYHYILEFKRARKAIELFLQGKELECIEQFFGAHEDSHKQRIYLRDSIDFYNQWKKKLETPVNSDVDALEKEIDGYLTL